MAHVDTADEVEVDAAPQSTNGWAAIRKRVQQKAIAQAVANAFPEHVSSVYTRLSICLDTKKPACYGVVGLLSSDFCPHDLAQALKYLGGQLWQLINIPRVTPPPPKKKAYNCNYIYIYKLI